MSSSDLGITIVLCVLIVSVAIVRIVRWTKGGPEL